MPLAFSLQDTVEEGGSIKQANSESHDAHKSEPLQEKTWFFSLESCVRLLQKKYCWCFRNPKQPLVACIKPCKQWDKLPTSTGDRRISAINSSKIFNWILEPTRNMIIWQYHILDMLESYPRRMSWWSLLQGWCCIGSTIGRPFRGGSYWTWRRVMVATSSSAIFWSFK